ncbi:hypothetical protein LRY58_03830 [Candidatus Woesebacteria bacterium]|nr:hypothetical protein [Candidatus Woesebacteria bacterium]MCD8546775.1 hypothetical protein [Candidatus Woesebacteria bacterium]
MIRFFVTKKAFFTVLNEVIRTTHSNPVVTENNDRLPDELVHNHHFQKTKKLIALSSPALLPQHFCAPAYTRG